MKKEKKIVLFILLFALILSSIFVYMRFSMVQGIKDTGQDFIAALASGDIQKAKQYAGGEVAFRLATTNTTKEIPRAQATKTEILTCKGNKKWARVEVQSEILLPDGSYDVDWYEMDMYRKDNWKVIKLRESTPVIPSQKTMFKQDQDLQDLEANLNGYFTLSKKGDFTQATKKYLAGPARRMQEQAIKNYPLKEIPKGFKITPLYGNKELIIAKAEYTFEGRHVRNMIKFYKTSEGWKIVEITNC